MWQVIGIHRAGPMAGLSAVSGNARKSMSLTAVLVVLEATVGEDVTAPEFDISMKKRMRRLNWNEIEFCSKVKSF